MVEPTVHWQYLDGKVDMWFINTYISRQRRRKAVNMTKIFFLSSIYVWYSTVELDWLATTTFEDPPDAYTNRIRHSYPHYLAPKSESATNTKQDRLLRTVGTKSHFGHNSFVSKVSPCSFLHRQTGNLTGKGVSGRYDRYSTVVRTVDALANKVKWGFISLLL